MGTTESFVAVLDREGRASAPEADLRWESPIGWRVFTLRDPYAYPLTVEEAARLLVTGDLVGVVAFVEDSDWSYVAGVTGDGVVARFVIHPDGAQDYEEGAQLLSVVSGDQRSQADGFSMFASIIGVQLSTDRILEIAVSDDTFAEQPMHQLLEELGIRIPFDALD